MQVWGLTEIPAARLASCVKRMPANALRPPKTGTRTRIGWFSPAPVRAGHALPREPAPRMCSSRAVT